MARPISQPQKRRSGREQLATLVRFDRPGNRAQDLTTALKKHVFYQLYLQPGGGIVVSPGRNRLGVLMRAGMLAAKRLKSKQRQNQKTF